MLQGLERVSLLISLSLHLVHCLWGRGLVGGKNVFSQAWYDMYVGSYVARSVAKKIKRTQNKKTKGTYSLSEPQVNAILELRLQKLTALGINEIEIEIPWI